MKDIDLTGKCGSCYYFHLIEGTANGECHKFPYGDDVVHDAAHPFFKPGRSRIKCKNYRTTPITNADKLRAMSDEELAEVIKHPCDIGNHIPTEWCADRNCGYQCSLDWLREEANDEN